VVLALLGVAQAIYPENHWQHATKLTVKNFFSLAYFYYDDANLFSY
jgi:hypothetical protein